MSSYSNSLAADMIKALLDEAETRQSAFEMAKTELAAVKQATAADTSPKPSVPDQSAAGVEKR